MEQLAIFLPLIAAAIVGLSTRVIGDRPAQAITCAAVFASCAISWWLFYDVALQHNPRTIQLFTWIESGSFHVDWALKIDTLTAVMLIVVTTVSSMVHLYSVGYMSHDHHKPRFMAYLSLFTFMMLMLVTADNLAQMFFGWEGVGVASYLLINFWFHKDSANTASIKAFLVNRVGDFGFALGIFAIFVLFGSVEFETILDPARIAAVAGQTMQFLSWEVHGLTVACLLLFMGAMGKSAQLGLHTWLPDAMEGPTPVSALIHAATMVTAGVFMVARLSPIFEAAPAALTVVTVLGGLTAIVAATIGMTQFDIKRVIAYSTMSQLGYMFFALGVGAYGAAIFHLMTHAFFKALLFLGAGSVIHAMSNEQDMRHMGGIAKLIPVTHAMMWIGSLALAGVGIPGVFGFAGFYSKDIILESAFAAHTGAGTFAFWMGILAAFLTAFYSWRLIILTFNGKPRADHDTMHHVHESGPIMLIPLFVLAVGAVLSGVLAYGLFVGEGRFEFWGAALAQSADDVLHHAHDVPGWVPLAPLVAGLLGIGFAYVAYLLQPGLPSRIARAFEPFYKLFFNRWYFDVAYRVLFIHPAMWLGRAFWKGGDGAIIDGLGPNGVAAATSGAGRAVARLQSGYIYHYAFAMVIGIVLLIGWFFFS